MNKQKFIEKIQNSPPKVLYLSGRTSTGKSTLAKEIKNILGCVVIELDEIIKHKIIIPNGIINETEIFSGVYRDQGDPKHTETFISETRSALRAALQNNSVVIEGSIASPRVIREIFYKINETLMFVFLNPVDTDAHTHRITKRLRDNTDRGNAGLPQSFWDLVPSQALAEYENNATINPEMLRAVEMFVEHSQAQSKERLSLFQESLSGIQVIEV